MYDRPISESKSVPGCLEDSRVGCWFRAWSQASRQTRAGTPSAKWASRNRKAKQEESNEILYVNIS